MPCASPDASGPHHAGGARRQHGGTAVTHLCPLCSVGALQEERRRTVTGGTPHILHAADANPDVHNSEAKLTSIKLDLEAKV